MERYVSRAGKKLDFALKTFGFNVSILVCADFGSNVGGFVQVLLQHGAKHVYSVDTSYGTLDWGLRNNAKVTVLERTNAMHVFLPEKCDLITVDTGWTPQTKILPNVLRNLKEKGSVISLVKPHYEAKGYGISLNKGLVNKNDIPVIISGVESDIKNLGLKIVNKVQSPIIGKHGGNTEYLYLLNF